MRQIENESFDLICRWKLKRIVVRCFSEKLIYRLDSDPKKGKIVLCSTIFTVLFEQSAESESSELLVLAYWIASKTLSDDLHDFVFITDPIRAMGIFKLFFISKEIPTQSFSLPELENMIPRRSLFASDMIGIASGGNVRQIWRCLKMMKFSKRDLGWVKFGEILRPLIKQRFCPLVFWAAKKC